MAGYYDSYVSRYHIESPISRLVHDITTYVKIGHDYEKAIALIMENNLKLEDVVSCTARLTMQDVVKLADLLILRKSK